MRLCKLSEILEITAADVYFSGCVFPYLLGSILRQIQTSANAYINTKALRTTAIKLK